MRTYAPAEHGVGPGVAARGAVDRPRRRAPPAHPREAGGVRAVAGVAGPAASGPGSRARGIERLYTHQAEAVEAVHAGEDIVVVTPTASGKTLCYALPVLQAIADDPAARALFLFPTKALGQDQVAEFSELSRAAGLSISAATYDGDTPGPDPVGRPEGRPGRRHEPGHAELRRSSPTTRSGSSCSSSSGSSSSTSCTRTAASTAATSRTSSGGCSGCAPTTAARRSSSAARRRSRTRRSWPRC